MRHLLIGLLGIAAAQPAAATETPDRIGRIYTYVRSDRDGGEAETIHVYRESRTHIGVTKMRERCTNAAYVTADLDLERGYATRLDTPDGPLSLATAVPDTPWHLYDFDLASLTVTAQYRPDRRADMSFGLPLIWPDGGPEGLISYLGRADLTFVRAEWHGGRRALRFEAGGPAFNGRGGPIWFDAAEGHILEASWGIPNHSEYRDFRLRLVRVSDGGAAEWRRLLTAHFENCPAQP